MSESPTFHNPAFPNPTCDHTLGYSEDAGYSLFIRSSMPDYLRDLLTPDAHHSYRFKFCPDCGAKMEETLTARHPH